LIFRHEPRVVTDRKSRESEFLPNDKLQPRPLSSVPKHHSTAVVPDVLHPDVGLLPLLRQSYELVFEWADLPGFIRNIFQLRTPCTASRLDLPRSIRQSNVHPLGLQ